MAVQRGEANLPMICVETRHMRAVLKATINKTDRNDARGIVQMMRVVCFGLRLPEYACSCGLHLPLDDDRERKSNVEPWPGCDSTQIRPPCISMMRLDMASPKPVPPFLRVMALSAC
jgi:hypothetical protein